MQPGAERVQRPRPERGAREDAAEPNPAVQAEAEERNRHSQQGPEEVLPSQEAPEARAVLVVPLAQAPSVRGPLERAPSEAPEGPPSEMGPWARVGEQAARHSHLVARGAVQPSAQARGREPAAAQHLGACPEVREAAAVRVVIEVASRARRAEPSCRVVRAVRRAVLVVACPPSVRAVAAAPVEPPKEVGLAPEVRAVPAHARAVPARARAVPVRAPAVPVGASAPVVLAVLLADRAARAEVREAVPGSHPTVPEPCRAGAGARLTEERRGEGRWAEERRAAQCWPETACGHRRYAASRTASSPH